MFHGPIVSQEKLYQMLRGGVFNETRPLSVTLQQPLGVRFKQSLIGHDNIAGFQNVTAR